MTSIFLEPTREIMKLLDRNMSCRPRVDICGASKSRAKSRLAIQRLIIEAGDKISSGANATDEVKALRKAIASCPKLNRDENFHKGGMNDSSVFLTFFLEFFPCLNISVVVAKNEKSTSRKIKKSMPLIYLTTPVYLNELCDKKFATLIKKTLGTTVEGDAIVKFQRTPKFVIFDLTRIGKISSDHSYKYRSNIAVKPASTLNVSLANGKKVKLKLVAIVCWVDAHYTCFVKARNNWWFVDAASDAVPVKIGSLKNACRTSATHPNVLTDAKNYFYASEKSLG
jgi:hypothetical protein